MFTIFIVCCSYKTFIVAVSLSNHYYNIAYRYKNKDEIANVNFLYEDIVHTLKIN